MTELSAETQKRIDARLALPKIVETKIVGRRETQESCAQWAMETFGKPSSLFSIATRANEELAELLRAVSKIEPGKAIPTEITFEAADTLIVLYRLAQRTGIVLRIEPNESGARTVRQAAVAANENMVRVIALLDGVDAVEGAMQQILGIRLYWVVAQLAKLCCLLGADIEVSVDLKMAINRRRQWNVGADGHGYHVKGVVPVHAIGDPEPVIQPVPGEAYHETVAKHFGVPVQRPVSGLNFDSKDVLADFFGVPRRALVDHEGPYTYERTTELPQSLCRYAGAENDDRSTKQVLEDADLEDRDYGQQDVGC